MEPYDKSNISNQIIKVVQTLGFLLNLDENRKMNRVKLIKLLWAADRFHLRKYGRTVSRTDYVAMTHGPVSSLALDIARVTRDFALSDDAIKYIEHYFTATERETVMSLSPGEGHLSRTDKDALQWAWDTFSASETFELADTVSHAYPEWSQHRRFFEASKSGSRPIDVKTFLENPEDDQYFNTNPEALQAAKELYQDTVEAESELSSGLKL